MLSRNMEVQVFLKDSVARLLVLLMGATASCAHAQNQGWTSPWTLSAPPSLSIASTAPSLAGAANGDVVLAAASPTLSDYQVIRFSATGTFRWAINLGGNDGALDGDIDSIFAAADGSAFVAFGGPFAGYLAKISANGSLLWSRRIPEATLLASSTGPVIVAGCDWVDSAPTIVSALDRDDGSVLWQRFYPNSTGSNCQLGDIAGDESGDVYLTLASRLEKLDSAGHTLWSATLSGANRAWPIGGDASRAFVRTDQDVRALSSADGAPIWLRPIIAAGAGALRGDDGTIEPVVESGAISRLAADTGLPRWSAGTGPLRVIGNAIILGGAARLDPANGSTLWEAMLPTADADGNGVWSYAFDGSDAGSLVAAGRTHAFGAPAAVVESIDADTGVASAIPLPSSDRGIGNPFTAGGQFSVVDGQNVFSTAVAQGLLGPEIHLRRQHGHDGLVVWEASEPAVLFAQSTWGYVPSTPSLVVTATAIVVTCAENYNSGTGSYSGITWVAAFNPGSGALLWSTQFADPYQQTTAVTAPQIAADGNVFLATGTSFAVPQPNEPFPQQFGQISVYKVSIVDGQQLWRRDAVRAYAGGYYADTPVMSVIGDDVVAAGAFETEPLESRLVRMAGSNGATIWASDIFSPNEVQAIYPFDDSSLIALGGDWAKVDTTDGITLWDTSWNGNSDCPYPQCYLNAGPALPGGDILEFGSALGTPWLVRLHGDGSGLADDWQPETPVAGVRSSLEYAGVDSLAQVWTRLSRRLQDPPLGISFIARFDVDTGHFAGQQAIGNLDGDPFAVTNSSNPIGAPENQRLFVNAFMVDQPAPATIADALIDTTVVAAGDLTAMIDVDRTVAMPGQDLLFHLEIGYSGDAPLTGARLTARLPWADVPIDVVCQIQAAGNCVASPRGGGLDVGFDIDPGGSIDVAARIKVLESTSSTPAFGLAVSGPPGLVETQTQNNLARRAISQSIFLAGFE
jgi:outer membrane protein assembly factor BamB